MSGRDAREPVGPLRRSEDLELTEELGVPPEAWPLRALTMGLGTIRGARALLVLATGAAKATALRALVQGAEDPDWPCSFLGKHADLEVLLDPAAASAL